ncbi:ribonuclease III [candidate division KSB1 bacterium]|nr:ribonuclease III [candidate division KSB1 bacterium]
MESKLDYQFKNKDVLIQALKHRSFLAVTGESRLYSNERLELLGDSVLGIIVTEHLYKKYPEKEEGDLTSMKSLIVSRKILARTANNLNLGKYILLNDAEKKAGGRHRPSIVADAFEALTGAIYLDGGLMEAIKFIHSFLLVDLSDLLTEEQNQNYKSMLLEYSQSQNYGLPVYVVKKETGPDHNKTFTIEVRVNDSIRGIGIGNSKKKAEQIAAKNALKKLLVN